jgi:hypothetical protein
MKMSMTKSETEKVKLIKMYLCPLIGYSINIAYVHNLQLIFKFWEKFKNDHDFSHNSRNNQTKF